MSSKQSSFKAYSDLPSSFDTKYVKFHADNVKTQTDNILEEPERDKMYEFGLEMRGLENDLKESLARERELRDHLKKEVAIKKAILEQIEGKRQEMVLLALMGGDVGHVRPGNEFKRDEQRAAGEKYLNKKRKLN